MLHNKPSLKDRLLSKAAWSGDCLLWRGARHPRGWGLISIGGRYFKAYRVSYEVHHGPIPDGLVVMHSCDTPACINPEHLRLGTQGDNVRDMHSKGRAVVVRGESNHKSKLTTEQVIEIRGRYMPRSRTNGAGQLARDFGVSKTSILAVIKRRAWQHV